jgi:N-acetylneuraminate synthase
MSAPYDFEAVAHLDPFVNAYKIGSGDINWLEELEVVAGLGKPIIVATGAATFEDVQRTMDMLLPTGLPLVLMQCNTNYEGSLENIHHVNLRVLQQYAREFPTVTLGLSDHTPGHLTVLGAVALGARVVEKHFTDDSSLPGPDHGFSMDPVTWRAMVEDTRKLEAALGTGVKGIEDNELHTVVLQRRCVRAQRDLPQGTTITRSDLVVLRPAPREAIPAHVVTQVPGKVTIRDILAGDVITWADLT